ncbi:hypothetical protein FRC08_015875 [Ceratobasidium sp. 394]|nr:hypothetical protein FRC08_015875 [Ceratobasidium sp. 394]KAG9089323.1 hypothetical protein FS749_001428 [Ceratobasidium sp. UAMH 11750]
MFWPWRSCSLGTRTLVSSSGTLAVSGPLLLLAARAPLHTGVPAPSGLPALILRRARVLPARRARLARP